MEQKIFKVERGSDGLVLLGKNTSQALSPDDIFFSVSSYGKPPYISTPRRIEIPPKYEYKGELLDIVEISGHPFEECNDLEELVIPETVRRIHWNGCGRLKLKRFIVHPDNPVFQDIDGVLFTRIGYNRDGISKYHWMELIAYPSGKGFDYIVPNGVTRLGNQSFKYTSISYLELPTTLKEIGMNVFYGCKNLKELEIPTSVVKIENLCDCPISFKVI